MRAHPPAVRRHPAPPSPARPTPHQRRPKPAGDRGHRETPVATEPAAAAFQVPTDNCPPNDAGVGRWSADQDRLHRAADRSVGRIRRHRSGHEGVLRQDQRRGRRRRRSPDRGDHQGRCIRSGQVGTGRSGSARRRQDLRLSVPGRHAERRRHAAAPRRRVCATGTRRHWLPAWGDPANFPWTTGGIPSYTVEAKVWVEFIKQKFPDAKKVAILSFNNDFGKTYKTTLDEAFPTPGTRSSPTSPTRPPRTCPTRSPSCWPADPTHHRRNDVDVLHEPDDPRPPGWLHRDRSSTRTPASRSSSSWCPQVRQQPTCSRSSSPRIPPIRLRRR